MGKKWAGKKMVGIFCPIIFLPQNTLPLKRYADGEHVPIPELCFHPAVATKAAWMFVESIRYQPKLTLNSTRSASGDVSQAVAIKKVMAIALGDF